MGPTAHAELPAPLLRALDTPYVGRRDLLQELQQHVARAGAGQSASVLIAGEPGIGKTRTAAELARFAADAGMTVVYGRCDEGLGAPYQPFAEAIERYARTAPEPELGRLDRELVRLVPRLLDLVPGIESPLPSDPRTEEFRLHEAIVAWLADASQPSGLLFVVDDLHWADPATLLLLGHVLHQLLRLSARVLVVGTFRDTEPGTDPRLMLLTATLRTYLAGLGEPDIVEMLTRDAGHPLDDAQLALVTRVHAECDGNPYFVRELRRHLVETGRMTHVEGRWQLRGKIEVPDSVRGLVARRLTSLGSGTRDVLRSASVLGRMFSVDDLAAALGLPAGLVTDALEEALRARLVEEKEPGRFRFSHALVRTTLYDGLTPPQRAAAHRRVLEVLRSTADVAVLARHALLSGPTGDGLREAAQWSIAAGEQALASRALADAERWFETAVGVLTDAPGDGRLTAVALCGLGEAQRDLSEPAYRETLARASTLGDALGQVDVVVRAALSEDRGTTLVAAPDPGRLARVERALQLVGPAPSEARALLLVRQVGEVTFAGDPDLRRRLALEAEAMARHLRDPYAVARVMVRLGMATHMLTGGQGSLERAQRNVRLADEAGDPALRVTALSWLSASQIVAGELGSSEETAALMAEVAREASPTMQWFARMLQIKYLSLRGDVEGAAAENDACLAQGLELREPDAEMIWGANAAGIAVNAGTSADFADAAGVFAQEQPTVRNWQAGHVAFLAEAGRLEETRAALARYALDPSRLMEEPFAYQGPWSLAVAAMHLRDADLARAVQRVLAPHRGRWSHIYLAILGPVRWALGRCAIATGALDAAVVELTEALSESRAAGADAVSSLVSLDLASALAERAGRNDRAAALDLLATVGGRTQQLDLRADRIRAEL